MSAEAWGAALLALWEVCYPLGLGVVLGWKLNDGFAERRHRRNHTIPGPDVADDETRTK